MRAPLGGHSHIYQTSSRADDDWLFPAQEDAQTFLLNWRMKTANYSRTAVAQCFGEIIGSKDQFTGATNGSKEADLLSLKQNRIAENVRFQTVRPQ